MSKNSIENNCGTAGCHVVGSSPGLGARVAFYGPVGAANNFIRAFSDLRAATGYSFMVVTAEQFAIVAGVSGIGGL